MAGYSGTPLLKKLGIHSGMRVHFRDAPDGYLLQSGLLPDDVRIAKTLQGKLDFIHYFVKERAELESFLSRALEFLEQSGMIWISWPKKASKVPTDITEQTIRDVCLPMGLVDVKVCAVDEIWSGLKLVVRRELRRKK